MESNTRDEIRSQLEKHEMMLLAHNYQVMAIQECSDLVGDSLELSKTARDSKFKKIMFSAVYFMAETAAILSPDKQIMIAVREAGCPLADSIKTEDLIELKRQHPKAPVMCYINSNSEIKALSDVVCTSSNAVRIATKLPSDEIIFVPDQGLGSWIAEKTGKKVHLHKGCCNVHWHIPVKDIKQSKYEHPDALLVVHPECTPEIRNLADHVVGTSGMIDYVKQNPRREFLIGTEIGMKQRLEKMFPKEKFFMASKMLVCPNMKKTYPQNLLEAIINESTTVKVDPQIAELARKAIERMYEF
jgi:quinolinate synthase